MYLNSKQNFPVLFLIIFLSPCSFHMFRFKTCKSIQKASSVGPRCDDLLNDSQNRKRKIIKLSPSFTRHFHFNVNNFFSINWIHSQKETVKMIWKNFKARQFIASTQRVQRIFISKEETDLYFSIIHEIKDKIELIRKHLIHNRSHMLVKLPKKIYGRRCDQRLSPRS